MSKLICDICGTSYSDSVDKCPTCGYSRAFEEPVPDEPRTPAVREKVRGGRFSKKNVRKRLQIQAKAERKLQEPVLAEELSMPAPSVPEITVDEPYSPVQEPAAEPVVLDLPELEEPAPEEAQEEAESAAEPVVLVLPELEEPAPEEAQEEAEPAAEPVVLLLPELEEPAPEEAQEEAEPAAEPVVLVLPELEELAPEEAQEEAEPAAEPVVLDLPELEEPAPEEPVEEAAEPMVIVLPGTEEPAREEDAPATELPPVPVVMEEGESGTQETAQADNETEEKSQKKKKGGCLLNVVLYTSLAVFLASAIYLLVSYGIPYLKDMDWPTRPAAETTMTTQEPTQAPTDAPTEAPTDAPTEAPTDPPTEAPTQAPTDPPTDPPTEAPTEPLLDVTLELNYYDLTFGAANQGTQLEAKDIPNEDITWISDDPAVVTVSETGKIISVGGGKTTVRAIYGDQEATVKINCAF